MIIFIDLARFFIRRPYPMRPALVNLLGSVAIALRKNKIILVIIISREYQLQRRARLKVSRYPVREKNY